MQPIQAVIPRLLVLGQPLVQRPKARGFQAEQPAAAAMPAISIPRLLAQKVVG